MERQGHVTAIFGGRRIRFELKRDAWSIGVLEALGLSPFTLYTRLGRGAWSHDNLLTILSLAYTPGRDLLAPEVEAMVMGQPYGSLVPLLGLVLEAHLFGLAPERGHFA